MRDLIKRYGIDRNMHFETLKKNTVQNNKQKINTLWTERTKHAMGWATKTNQNKTKCEVSKTHECIWMENKKKQPKKKKTVKCVRLMDVPGWRRKQNSAKYETLECNGLNNIKSPWSVKTRRAIVWKTQNHLDVWKMRVQWFEQHKITATGEK